MWIDIYSKLRFKGIERVRHGDGAFVVQFAKMIPGASELTVFNSLLFSRPSLSTKGKKRGKSSRLKEQTCASNYTQKAATYNNTKLLFSLLSLYSLRDLGKKCYFTLLDANFTYTTELSPELINI